MQRLAEAVLAAGPGVVELRDAALAVALARRLLARKVCARSDPCHPAHS